MGLSFKIPRQGKIYLDTNLYIYFFENNLQYADEIENLLNLTTEKKITLIASTLLLSEILVSPYKTKNKQLLQIYQNLDQTITNLNLIPLNKKIADQTAFIRAKYDIRTPDAIHLATAIDQQANLFVTADQQLSKVKEINVEIVRPA